MLNLTPHVCHSPNVTKTLLPFHKPFFHGFAFLPVNSRPSSSCRKTTKSFKASRFGSLKVNAALSSSVTIADYVKASTSTVKAVVTVQQTDCFGFLTNLAFEGPIVDIVKRGIVDIVDRAKDDIADLMGKSIFLELVSADLNPKETGHEKEKIKGYAHRVKQQGNNVIYEAEFTVGGGFGEIGAVVVENEHHKEMFLVNIKLSGFSNNGPITVKCNSWVHSKFDNHQKRVFFTDKSYLPSQTPSGLNRWRKDELKNLRGNGTGERETFERIYDYDVYNDIGDPDSDLRKKRPVLGGNKQFPYPRRCRTGRPQCQSDPLSEKKSNLFYYVPRDEAFSEVKQLTFYADTLSSVFHALIPNLEVHGDPDRGFPSFKAIDQLFDEGIDLPLKAQLNFWKTLFPRLLKLNWRTVVSSVLDYIQDESRNVLSFERPETMKRDKFFWLKDEEFARQTLAGMNPCTIQLITEWPLKSKLDPKIYGHAESAITKEMIETEIKGLMTFEEALKQKKLFIIDYHDLLLPYVEKVRGIDGTTLYGSRTIFFLNPDETLKPLAIELTCPPINGKPQWKHVYQPAWNASGVWLWELAKAHFLAHDSGVHQLVSHWLRTHCCTEPYIIATNRQLSAMHPIYRLLHPHFRYTMKINALARETLINAEGIIETSFSPGKYSMELSSVAYGLQWRFDQQALPADLISRGMAVEDPSAPYGLRLTIGDYPYANDGLIIWDIIKQWVSDYVNHYYPNGSFVESDQELQTWWTEIRTVGHADKKDEPGWPDLKTTEDLINIITIIAWVASGHHAAVNFGQYTYAGYFPNRPTIARKNMPTEEATEWELFMNKPEDLLLLYFPSQIQATKVMGVLDVLSEHSPDEEYLGENSESAWDENPVIKAAFEKFSGRLKELEGIVDERNANPDLKNRNGAGIVPYEFLKPFSESGLTGKGVPYSISI